MGGLMDTLNIGYSGLVAARAGVQLTSHNITNAETEGYHRRRLVLSPNAPPPTLGGGVSIDGISRVNDQLLGVQVEQSRGEQAFANAKERMMLEVENATAPISDTGLGRAISDLFASFSQLSTSPNDMTVRNEALSSARSMADSFNRAASQLEAVRDAADTDIEHSLTPVNGWLSEIAQLNGKIAAAEGANQDASDLRDRQDQLIANVAEKLGTHSFVDKSGQTTVLLGGLTLVQKDHAATLEAVPDAALGGHVRVDVLNGNVRTSAMGSLGGAIGGTIDVRDGTTVDAINRLDQLAFDVASAVNAQHAAGFGLDSSTGLDLFTIPGAAAGSASTIALNAAVGADQLAASSDIAGLPGNNENALLLAGLASSTIAAGGTRTAASEVSTIAGWVGGVTRDVADSAIVASDQLAHLETMQMSTEGVSMDEEMVRLVEYQRSYQASARVISTVNGLMDTLMRLGG
jgi:flagellar hook-associated protein 1 FlgK